VSALAHFIEDEGIATTGISLVREHTAGYRPPRFLWVPFPLGRPFGAPGEPDFQRRVLQAALSLLEREDGPVILEDFPDDAPTPARPEEGGDDGWACPVGFPPPPLAADDLGAAMGAEVAALAPWHELAVARRGRTTVGLTGAPPARLAGFIAGFLDGTPAPLRGDRSLAENLKLAMEDLKAYYQEGAMAQPGAADAQAVARWFWEETAAARALLALRAVLEEHPDAGLRRLARDYLVPRVQAHRLRDPDG
jgi:hypothetical protein